MAKKYNPNTKGTEMAKLTYKEKKSFPKSVYGLPSEKKYPMPDKAHAVNAKARATQMVDKGKLSKSAEAKIDAKANKILNKGKNSAKKCPTCGK